MKKQLKNNNKENYDNTHILPNDALNNINIEKNDDKDNNYEIAKEKNIPLNYNNNIEKNDDIEKDKDNDKDIPFKKRKYRYNYNKRNNNDNNNNNDKDSNNNDINDGDGNIRKKNNDISIKKRKLKKIHNNDDNDNEDGQKNGPNQKTNIDNDNEMSDEKEDQLLLYSDRINNDIKEKENENKLLIEQLYRKRDNNDNNKNKNIKESEDVKNNNDIKDDHNNNKYKESKEENKDKFNKINPKKEDDENAINNALISQISPYKKEENQIIPEKEKEKEKEKENLNNSPLNKNNDQPTSSLSKKADKKISFDDNVIYINYDEDEYVTIFQLTDKNGKVLPYKEKDFSKYLRLLTSVSHTNKIKPIIIDLNKKKKNTKKTKIMQRNMDYIKEVEKTGNVYKISKEKQPKKKVVIENMEGCPKFLENPQQFYTEDLCDAVLLSLNLPPKESSRSSSANRKK